MKPSADPASLCTHDDEEQEEAERVSAGVENGDDQKERGRAGSKAVVINVPVVHVKHEHLHEDVDERPRHVVLQTTRGGTHGQLWRGTRRGQHGGGERTTDLDRKEVVAIPVAQQAPPDSERKVDAREKQIELELEERKSGVASGFSRRRRGSRQAEQED